MARDVETPAVSNAVSEPTATVAPPPSAPVSKGPVGVHVVARRPLHLRRVALIAIIVVAVGLGAYYLVPWVITALNTVSTDDAYVNGHVTFVAPRVPGQVSKVLVDDNDRVHKGDLLVQLDKEPYRVQVDVEAGGRRDVAQADLVVAAGSGARHDRAGAGQSLQAGARDRGRGQPNRPVAGQRRRTGKPPRPSWPAPRRIIERAHQICRRARGPSAKRTSISARKPTRVAEAQVKQALRAGLSDSRQPGLARAAGARET